MKKIRGDVHFRHLRSPVLTSLRLTDFAFEVKLLANRVTRIEMAPKYADVYREWRRDPVASLKTILNVDRLPKTRSGKILRGTIRDIINGEDWEIPATIEDPEILHDITQTLIRRRVLSAQPERNQIRVR